jgi:hypothetical protein
MSQSNNWKTTTYALIGTVIILTLVVGAIVYTQQIQSSGTITAAKAVNCNLYADAAGTQPITAINWGSVSPDSAINQTIWAKNTGNTPTNYTMTVTNWNPTNSNTYIGLTADFKGVTNAAPGSIIPIVITLSISPTAPQGPFSNTIVIAATG